MEVTNLLQLNDEERQMLDMHSILNIANILMRNVRSLSSQCQEMPPLKTSVKEIENFKSFILKNDKQSFTNAIVGDFHKKLSVLLHEVKERCAEDQEAQQKIQTIEEVLQILDKRSDELLARWAFPDLRLEFPAEKLKEELKNFLKSVEKNASGRYRIVFDPKEQGPNDYLVEMQIPQKTNLTMPLAIKDALIDLLANARKYTDPGGEIKLSIDQNENRLLIKISDTGIGIPPDEIKEVIAFGKRGSNAADRPTMGSGYGLTKALASVQRYGGRMWIDSAPGKGTEVKMEIPFK